MSHTVRLYRDKDGDWRWSRRALNGDIVADSGEGYRNYASCVGMAEEVNGNDVTYITEEPSDEPGQ